VTNMPDSLEASSNARTLRLAAALAAIAAVFIITVWAPMQIRAFDHAVTGDTAPLRVPVSDWQHLQLVTAGGALTDLASLNGHVRIVTMVYAHCPGICPLTLATLRNIERQLLPRQREQLKVVAIGLNPQDGSVESLNRAVQPFMAAGSHWTVGMPSREGVPGFARALGVRYQDIGDGSIDHQSVFVLLDENGNILGRTEHTQQIDSTFMAALNDALN
jgi:protein SCO1